MNKIDKDEDGYLIMENGKISWIHERYVVEKCYYPSLKECPCYVPDEKLKDFENCEIYGFDNGQWHVLAGRSGIIGIRNGKIAACYVDCLN